MMKCKKLHVMKKEGKRMFSYDWVVQYYETDQMAIVHHSNYIRWFESARTAYLSEVGFRTIRWKQQVL